MAVAAVLAGVLFLSASFGCASEDMTWAAKSGDVTMPIGTYIYFLAVACNDAADLVEDEETPVLEQQVEDKDAETWIRDKAEYYVRYYFTILKMMEDRGLSLTEEEQSAAATQAAVYFNQSSSMMEEYGIAQASYTMATTEQSQMITKLFLNIYGEGGEQEVPDSELEAYFEENYSYYEYLPQSLYVYDEEGSLTAMEEDQKAEVKTLLDGYAEEYNSGNMTGDEIVEAYKGTEYYTSTDETEDADTTLLYSSVEILDDSTTIGGAVLGIDSGKATVADLSGTTGAYYLLFRHDIKEMTEEWITNEENRNQLLSEYKNDDFQEMVEAEMDGVSIELNTEAMNAQRISKFM